MVGERSGWSNYTIQNIDNAVLQNAQHVAAAKSAEINKAYQTLLSPLKRAEYLLAMRGFQIGEEEKLDSELDVSEFLVEVLEARQELENAETEEEVESIVSRNKGTMVCILGTFSPLIVPLIRPDTS